MITITREHSFDAGHRVSGHESKCANLHGHTYKVQITATANSLDSLGRVIDFSVLKTVLCSWLDQKWDHKLLLFVSDPYYDLLKDMPGVVGISFNPTAEQMARYLGATLFPKLLRENGLTHITIVHVAVHETAKCAADWSEDAIEVSNAR